MDVNDVKKKFYNSDARRDFRGFVKNREWIAKNCGYLNENYLEKYVLVDKQKVVDSDKDLRSLLSRKKKNYPDNHAVVIEYVTKSLFILALAAV